MTVSCLVAFAFLGCSPKQEHRHRLEFAGESVAIPIRFVYDRPVVDVMINGRGPFVLLFDTGSTGISLDRSVVKQLQLPDLRTVTRINAAAEEFEVRVFGVDRIEMGETLLAKVGVEETEIFEKSGMSGIHGMWGMAHFGKRIVSVDFLKKTLRITSQHTESAEESAWVPMRMDVYSPEAPIQIGGKHYDFLIDTGSNGSLSVSASAASELPCYKNRFRERIAVAGGHSKWTISTRLRSDILLGGHSVERPYVSWIEGLPGRNLIGMEVLRHFSMEFDLIENRVRFLREGGSPLSFPNKRRLGIWIARHPQDNSSVISQISSYRAVMDDLKIGDRILTIDGQAMSSITENLLQELIRRRNSLAFTVQRNGEIVAIDVLVRQDSFALGP